MQNFKNHRKYYPFHHFFILPVLLIITVVATIGIFKYPEQQNIYTLIAALSFLSLLVAIMLRQHYALGNQNRIVRLEMRLRYFEITGKRFYEIEKKLRFGQIAALRFASDAELLPLIEKAITENLSSTAIKKSIQNWEADDMRV